MTLCCAGCGLLVVDNAEITYSNNLEFESVANHTCNPGFLLNGSATRNCGSCRWEGIAPSCGEYCKRYLFIVPPIQLPLNQCKNTSILVFLY